MGAHNAQLTLQYAAIHKLLFFYFLHFFSLHFPLFPMPTSTPFIYRRHSLTLTHSLTCTMQQRHSNVSWKLVNKKRKKKKKEKSRIILCSEMQRRFEAQDTWEQQQQQLARPSFSPFKGANTVWTFDPLMRCLSFLLFICSFFTSLLHWKTLLHSFSRHFNLQSKWSHLVVWRCNQLGAVSQSVRLPSVCLIGLFSPN